MKRRINENARRRLTEDIDWSSYPTSTDFRDKDAWWKQQVDTDFPGHKVKSSDDWKVTYSDLNLDKQRQEKEQAKAARAAKRQERADAKAARATKRKEAMDLFLKTVDYIVLGEDMLENPGEPSDEIPDDWYDGVMKVPIVLRDGTKLWGSIDGIYDGVGDDAYINSGWGISFGDNSEDEYVVIQFGVYIVPNRRQIQFVIKKMDNTNVSHRTQAEITRYLNYLIPKKYKEVAMKLEKYRGGNGGSTTIPESRLRNIVKESISKVMLENSLGRGVVGGDIFGTSLNAGKEEKLPKGWEKIDREDDEPIYRDGDGNEYVKDEYGKLRQI